MSLSQQLLHGLYTGLVDYHVHVVGQVDDEVVITLQPVRAGQARETPMRCVVRGNVIEIERPQ